MAKIKDYIRRPAMIDSTITLAIIISLCALISAPITAIIECVNKSL